MKRTIVKIIGITISIILLSQSLNVFAVTKKEVQQKKDDAQKLDVISTLGEPNGEDITNEYELYTWNKYELLRGYDGVLQFSIDLKYNTVSWKWKHIGPEADYQKICSVMDDEFGEKNKRTFSDDTLGNGYIFTGSSTGIKNCNSIWITYNDNTTNISWVLGSF